MDFGFDALLRKDIPVTENMEFNLLNPIFLIIFVPTTQCTFFCISTSKTDNTLGQTW